MATRAPWWRGGATRPPAPTPTKPAKAGPSTRGLKEAEKRAAKAADGFSVLIDNFIGAGILTGEQGSTIVFAHDLSVEAEVTRTRTAAVVELEALIERVKP